MKKIKYNPRIVKKVTLLSILGLLVIWFGVTVVMSFIPTHTTTDSRLLQTSIPAGEYRDYLLTKVNMDPAQYKEYDEKGNYSDDYRAFQEKLKGAQTHLDTPILLPYSDAIESDENNFTKDYEIVTNEGETVKGYKTGDYGSLTWEFEIPEGKAGFYYFKIKYLVPSAGRNGGSNAERSFLINGEELFDSLASVSFTRYYRDDKDARDAYEKTQELKKDLVGNNLKPRQEEIENVLVNSFIQDASGYIENPYLIYLNEGENTITMESIRENLVVFGLSIHSTDDSDAQVATYEEYREQYNDSQITSGVSVAVEAEDSLKRSSSSPTLYPISDRNSSKNFPNDPVQQKYNAIGGSKWSTAGDWLAWTIDVPEAGLYNITFRAKQDQSRGLFTTRKLYVNGELPFKEASNCRFYYNSVYDMITFGYTDDNGDDQPYYVYL